MKTLIITAHPSPEGFTHKIAKQYAGTKKTQDVEAEIINLYDEEWKMDFLTFPEISEKNPENSDEEGEEDDLSNPAETSENEVRERVENSVIQKLQDKISESDELVFVFPLWWGEAPAILKNMIDGVFASGFAFEFEKGKTMPKQLLKGKTARVFVTCDAPKIYYWFKGYPFKITWKDFILGFCGIKLQSFEVFDKMRVKDASGRKKLIEKVTKIALG